MVDTKPAFVITSLGNPKETIDACKPLGIKVFCDVIDLEYARKVEALGADMIIAINSRAGGHTGKIPPAELLALLKANVSIPIIAAGICNGKSCTGSLGSRCGRSIGQDFCASEEADVTSTNKHWGYGERYCTNHTIIRSPLTVINTPVQQIGKDAGWFERILIKNK